MDTLQPTVGLVLGYLYDIDYPSRRAEKIGLRERFALILNSYAFDECGKDFDEGMFFEILESLNFMSAVSKISVALQDEQNREFPSLSKLRSFYSGLNPEDRVPFITANFESEGVVQCYVETEFYDRVGGLMPYSDSYVFSFYLEHYNRHDLQRSILAYCLEKGVEVFELRQGSVMPQISWAKRIRDRFSF
jgi:hypothetical protein